MQSDPGRRVFAVTYPTDAVKDYQKYGGDTSGLSTDQAVAEVMARAKPGFKTYSAGGNQWGWMNTSQMQPLADLYQSLKLYSTSPKVASLYSDSLVSRCNSIRPRSSRDDGGLEA